MATADTRAVRRLLVAHGNAAELDASHDAAVDLLRALSPTQRVVVAASSSLSSSSSSATATAGPTTVLAAKDAAAALLLASAVSFECPDDDDVYAHQPGRTFDAVPLARAPPPFHGSGSGGKGLLRQQQQQRRSLLQPADPFSPSIHRRQSGGGAAMNVDDDANDANDANDDDDDADDDDDGTMYSINGGSGVSEYWELGAFDEQQMGTVLRVLARCLPDAATVRFADDDDDHDHDGGGGGGGGGGGDQEILPSDDTLRTLLRCMTEELRLVDATFNEASASASTTISGAGGVGGGGKGKGKQSAAAAVAGYAAASHATHAAHAAHESHAEMLRLQSETNRVAAWAAAEFRL